MKRNILPTVAANLAEDRDSFDKMRQFCVFRGRFTPAELYNPPAGERAQTVGGDWIADLLPPEANFPSSQPSPEKVITGTGSAVTTTFTLADLVGSGVSKLPGRSNLVLVSGVLVGFEVKGDNDRAAPIEIEIAAVNALGEEISAAAGTVITSSTAITSGLDTPIGRQKGTLSPVGGSAEMILGFSTKRLRRSEVSYCPATISKTFFAHSIAEGVFSAVSLETTLKVIINAPAGAQVIIRPLTSAITSDLLLGFLALTHGEKATRAAFDIAEGKMISEAALQIDASADPRQLIPLIFELDSDEGVLARLDALLRSDIRK